MSEWISSKDQHPPKHEKFLFSYEYGIGLGEWGLCYTEINGNSERTHEAYILILWPSEINDGNCPMTFHTYQIVEMDFLWMPLPLPPKHES